MKFVIFLLSLLVISVVGCASVQEVPGPSVRGSGQISLYLGGAERVSTDITFDLQSVSIISEDGSSLNMDVKPVQVDSRSLAGRQIILSEQSLPEGKYKRLRFLVKQALVMGKERTTKLALPAEGIEVHADIAVRRNASTPIFLTWDADSSIKEGYLFGPFFSVTGQVPELSNLLVYVTNEGSNNVSVINRQNEEVVGTIMVGRKPRGIAVGQAREHPRVYVANSDSDSVSVIDPTTNKVELEIPIRFGKSPEGIAVVRVSAEREYIFVANYESDNVSVIDASTYQETEKINTGDGPVSIAADCPEEPNAGTRSLSFEDLNVLRNYREKNFNVYVANKNSKDVSVIKMDSARNRPEGVFQVGVQWSPITLTVDCQRGKVFVGNFNYDSLSVIDVAGIARGLTAGIVSEITNVGNSVVGIISDPDLDRLYLLKQDSSEILIIRPFSESFGSVRTSMGPVLGSVPVGSAPRAFVMDPEGRKLFVVNRGSDSVSVIDRTTSREEKIIPVGKKPYGIAIFPF